MREPRVWVFRGPEESEGLTFFVLLPDEMASNAPSEECRSGAGESLTIIPPRLVKQESPSPSGSAVQRFSPHLPHLGKPCTCSTVTLEKYSEGTKTYRNKLSSRNPRVCLTSHFHPRSFPSDDPLENDWVNDSPSVGWTLSCKMRGKGRH